MVSAIHGIKRRIPKWVFPTLMVLMALIIIVFNDAFGDSEIFGIIAFCYFILAFFLLARWLFRQIRLIINLKNEKAKTELLHLKSQVNPHFFFNTLNNLYALTLKKSDKAPEIVIKLSEMMRYMLYECNEPEVPLSKEISYIGNYLELEKLRQGETVDIR